MTEQHTADLLMYSVLRGTENPATLYADQRGEDIDIAVFEQWPGDEAEQIANAKRLVACWNACKGLTTKDLERGGVGCLYSSVTAISKM